MNRPSLRKWLLLSAGILCVGFATAGIFLPILPTTPFLMLAAACFVRSSDRFYRWLIGHRLFGRYIKYYREYRAITVQSKILTLVLLWATIGYTAFAVVHSVPLRVLLLLIAAGVTIHVLRLRTLTRAMLAGETMPGDVERERG
jgi:hypothetical protein